MQPPIHKIKLFPLGVILLKGEQTYLHIFEPKYLQLLKDAMASDHTFGIPFLVDGKLTKFGTLVKVKKILRKYSNGTFDVLIEGTGNFTLLNIIEELEEKLYFSGMVEIQSSDKKSGMTLSTLFQMYLEKSDEITDPGNDQNHLLDDIAVCLSLSLQEKYSYIKCVGSSTKEAFLINQIRFMLFISELECKMEYNFSLN